MGIKLLLYTAGNPQDVKLAYDGFKVWDANKKPLTAHMHLTGEHRLVLTVDDRHAAYPVTVDPLTHAASLTLNVNGILGTSVNEVSSPVLAGYSLSGVKDVTGDGTDEIVIGAPLFTNFSGIAGGIATLTGLVKARPSSSMASITARPPLLLRKCCSFGLSTGALFGFSVASALLDGDTKGDIIVGAPLDFSILVGHTNQRSGSVYVYRGPA